IWICPQLKKKTAVEASGFRCRKQAMASSDRFGYDAAYQGSRGAFSEDAAIKLLTTTARLLPRDTLEEVFNSVSRGDAQFGVVPIENTLAGSIHQCYDLLFEHDLKIVDETVCHIEHALIAAPGVTFGDVRKALSHPVALAQCELFFRRHPQIQPVSVYD